MKRREVVSNLHRTRGRPLCNLGRKVSVKVCGAGWTTDTRSVLLNKLKVDFRGLLKDVEGYLQIVGNNGKVAMIDEFTSVVNLGLWAQGGGGVEMRGSYQ